MVENYNLLEKLAKRFITHGLVNVLFAIHVDMLLESTMYAYIKYDQSGMNWHDLFFSYRSSVY